MPNTIAIEDIERLRTRQGIEDIELRKGILTLRVGDQVRLTLLTSERSFPGETLLVRITRIHGSAFRGKLVAKPVSPGLDDLGAGAAIAFTATHIHSLARRLPASEQ
ncbi:MAG: hypothetical protein K2R98_32045 [Gemmataceae bacterium]|nr:hypothetical protein [Gemmataceae bacterium]